MDEIRVSGIYGKGYGQVAKAVMQDPAISIEAKGIYAYFCSFTGSGCNTAFPSVSKIISDLDVTDTTYYRHFKMLTEMGLITVEQVNGGNGKGFKRNIYTIEDYPAAYIQCLKDSGDRPKVTELIIREKSISAAGYGNVPKSVMVDSGISVSAKGLYTYLCAYAGASHNAIPSKDITLFQMHISSASYNKYTKDLESNGYITRSRQRDNGKMGRTVFSINRELPEESATPCTKISRTMESRTVDTCALKSRALESRAAKSGTNNPRRKPKKASKQTENPSIIAPACAPAPAREETERVIDAAEVLEEIAEAGALPYEYCTQPDKLETAIKIMTGAEYHTRTGAPEEERTLYCAFRDALCDMLRADTPPLRARGSQHSYAKVYERLQPLVVAGYDDYGEPYAELPHLYEGFVSRYKVARQKTPIGSEEKYIPPVIWTEICFGALEEADRYDYYFGAESKKI